MDKLRMESPDMTAQNIDRIAALFPNCVTEASDGHGGIKRAINFELLKQMLSPDVVDGDERYEFTWVGKKAAIVEANKPIRKTLRPCVEESKDWDTTENLYIEGDNLEVLKLLQESYLGKVKMIYIDPPYNTGNDFIYADDFMRSQEEENEQMGMYDEDDNRLFKNTDTNGRFHSDWCSMMYSRLMLARNLLTDDGVIFISIDVNEQHNLRKMCDEVFGASSFITDFIWNSRKSVSNDAVVSLNHNYTLVYAKNMATFYLKKADFKLPDTGEGFDNPDNDPRGPWKADPFDSPGIRPNLTYKIVNPKTGEEFLPPAGRCWRTGEKEYLQFVADGRIVYGKTGTGKPQLKRFYSEAQAKGITPKSLWDDVGTATDGTKEIQSIFASKVFDTPKPTSFIRRIVDLSCEKDSIILDFFSGSATTAHAVMQLNAEDGGHRKFIMVQLPEKCDEASEAYKAGYKNICEIGKERIRRAGEKIKSEIDVVHKDDYAALVQSQQSNDQKVMTGFDSLKSSGVLTEKGYTYKGKDTKDISCITYSAENPNDFYRFHPNALDIGFRVLKLDDTNMKDVYYAPDDYDQNMLAGLESNIKDDRTDLDLLFGCLIDWGLPLSLPYKSEKIDGCTVHTYNDGDLIACFDANIPESVVKEIAKRKPLRAVFRDSGFASSPEKINVFEIFKLYMPEDAGDISKRVRVI